MMAWNHPSHIATSTIRQLLNNKQKAKDRFSYRTCPICQQKLLVRINGSFVYKWISQHFSTYHHEWMHVVVNLHEK
ncbi:hypothetical protein AB4K20DRAFT_1905368 [Rhizopus microsporus]|uniref:Uncharacterized protein n=1 Tax=Rhizopus microsporus TaxID=58291 RepID=A0A1X0RMG3_RHIZD|nr:hypothetical protein BCV71DRAFT_70711 [Rhizopus microsporus]